MEKVTFIFTMNFLRSFKDDNYIYFLLDFVKGMELFDVIRDIVKKIKQIIFLQTRSFKCFHYCFVKL